MGLPEEMPSCDFRQAPRGALLCFLLAALLLQVAVGLKCYSYTGSFTGTFSLGPVPTVECGPAQNVCGEGLIRLSIGGPRTATVIHKGCYMAETQDLSSSSQGVNLRSYTHSRLCNQSLCNNRYQNSSHIPAFPTEPPSNASTSLLCYTCIGTTLENCSPSHAEQSHCYHDSARCFNGTFTATIGHFVVPIYVRSCQDLSCASVGMSFSWLQLQLQGSSCCAQPLCNGALEPVTTASTPTMAPATNAGPWPQPRPWLPLPALLVLLVLGALGLWG